MNPAQERAHAEASSGLSVSVVVNNYNYAHYLPQALDSVLAQLAPQDELIVVDDGSGDGSAEILASYAAQQHVRVIRQANRGQLSAVLEGLSVAHGDLCALLDSDDYFLPGYLARLRRHAEQNPDADFFFCAASPGGEAEEAVRATKAMLARIEVPPGLTGSSRWSTWAGGEFLGSPTSGLALRRALRDTLLEHRERLSDRVVIPRWAVRFFAISTTSHAATRNSADGIIVRLCSLLGAQKHYCATPGFYYRIHGANAYACLSEGARRYLQVARIRQFLRMSQAAMRVELRPRVEDVLREAAGRSRPLCGRRRRRLAVNYVLALLRCDDALLTRFRGLPGLSSALFRQAAAKPPNCG